MPPSTEGKRRPREIGPTFPLAAAAQFLPKSFLYHKSRGTEGRQEGKGGKEDRDGQRQETQGDMGRVKTHLCL